MSSGHSIHRRRFLTLSSMGILGGTRLGGAPPSQVEREPPDPSPTIDTYRTLGRTGFDVSDIAAGTFNGNPAILDTLLRRGVNYIDTSEYYYGGNEERQIGRVIQRHDRKRLFITDKIVVNRDCTRQSVLERTRGCLERLQTDYLDCMMMGVPPDVETLLAPGFHDAMAELKKEGRVRFVGASTHGTSRAETPKPDRDDLLFRMVGDGRFDVVLLIYNFMARYPAEKVLEACAEKQIGATLMKTNPVNHYQWAREAEADPDAGLPGDFKERMDRFFEEHQLRTPEQVRDAAIRFVLANRNAHSVCVSFSNFEDVDAYLRLSGSRMTDSDIAMLADYEKDYGSLYCRHACGICESSCPHHVPVNTVMRFSHYFEAQRREKYAIEAYSGLDGPKADLCRSCAGYCEKACPYVVRIQRLLARAHEELTLA